MTSTLRVWVGVLLASGGAVLALVFLIAWACLTDVPVFGWLLAGCALLMIIGLAMLNHQFKLDRDEEAAQQHERIHP